MPDNTCTAYLHQQGEVVQRDRAVRDCLATKLGIPVKRLNTLLDASAMRPGIRWSLS